MWDSQTGTALQAAFYLNETPPEGEEDAGTTTLPIFRVITDGEGEILGWDARNGEVTEDYVRRSLQAAREENRPAGSLSDLHLHYAARLGWQLAWWRCCSTWPEPSSSRDKKLRLTVNNKGGPPIPPETLDHLFERFYRGDQSRLRDEGSYGLGLAIGQAVVHNHGSTISAASTQEEGTTFTVQLPLGKEQKT